MRILAIPAVSLLALVLTASAAPAATWSEIGDAGELVASAQITVGTGALTQITGTLPTDFDRDLYCIRVTDEQAFRAWWNCASISDNDLFLFDPASNGRAIWDGCSGGLVQVSSAFITTNGTYYLGISPHNAEPLNPGAQQIWATGPAGVERSPDGPGAPGPLAGWTLGTLGGPFINYAINLTGAEFCDSPTPAVPSTWSRVKSQYR